MVRSKFIKGKIAGIFTAIPQVKKCIDDEIKLYGGNSSKVERIKKTIGLNKRFVADKETTTSDLCEYAADKLLDKMKIERSGIDALICVTQTPDYFQPATAAYLHGRLELSKNCAAFDVNLGCSGYIYGLWLAHMMIETGSCQNALLLVGDTLSKCVNPRDRAVAPLFGDAGSATLIEKTTENPTFFLLHTDGEGYNHLIIPAGAFRTPKSEETAKEKTDEDGNLRSLENLYMNGAEIFNFSIKVEPEAISELLMYSGKTKEEIDYIVFHQANKYIISNIARRLQFPLKKVPCDTVEKYGNQSGASIPATICDALKEDVSASRKSVIMSGFGVGLSWASCLTALDNIFCEIAFYKGERVDEKARASG
jgi:3-oxoacyl-[acyl-carrier-protein] synthase-3